MFDEKEPEDIFAGSEAETEAPGLVQPSKPNQAAQPVPPQPAFDEDVVASGPSRTLIIIAVVGALIVIGLIVMLIYVLMGRQSSPVAPVNNSLVPSAQTPSDQTLPVVPFPETNTQPEPQLPADTDKDGLTDAEEAEFRTNPTLADSDDDGLTDADEVRVWKTDPLDSDSDNDGFPDGTEVRAGYDPNAVGAKLLNVPQEAPSNATEPASNQSGS